MSKQQEGAETPTNGIGPQWTKTKIDGRFSKTKQRDEPLPESPIPHHENTHALMRFCGAEPPRYNVMTKRITLEIPELKKLGVHPDTEEDVTVSYLNSVAREWDYPTQSIREDISLLGSCNSYHPVTEWIESKPWDCVDRFDNLLNTIVSPVDRHTVAMYLRKWCVGAIAALYKSQNQADWRGTEGVLIFMGAEGIGKGEWLNNLSRGCPEKVYHDGLSLDTGNKDSLIEASRYWIAELGEMDGIFRKSDRASMKNYLTRSSDTIRVPYGKNHVDFPRRTVFAGTVNEEHFLGDEPNRRYWVFRVTSFCNDHNIDMQQFWAQMKKWFEDGVTYWLDTEAEKQAHALVNQDHKDLEDVVELAMVGLVKPGESDAITYDEGYYNASTITLALGLATSQSRSKALAKWLREHGFKERKKDRSFLVGFVVKGAVDRNRAA